MTATPKSPAAPPRAAARPMARGRPWVLFTISPRSQRAVDTGRGASHRPTRLVRRDSRSGVAVTTAVCGHDHGDGALLAAHVGNRGKALAPHGQALRTFMRAV